MVLYDPISVVLVIANIR